MLEEYVSRIQKFVPCEILGIPSDAVKHESGSAVWWCDRGPKAKVLSSEDLSRQIDRLAHESRRELRILIGGADGFSSQEEQSFPPLLRWSFGPLTLPHELASVVAAEQIYRAWSILKGLPYHGGH